MNPTQAISFVLMLTLASLLSGCLERKETITLLKDGRVTINHHIQGDAADWQSGDDARPDGSYWKITVTEATDENGKKKVTVEANREFGAHERLPGSFATDATPHAMRHLRWSTDIRRTSLGNGRTRVDFVRTYTPRPFGGFLAVRHRTIPDDVEKILKGEHALETADAATRDKIIAALIDHERQKWHAFAARGLELVFEGTPEAASSADAQRMLIGLRDAIDLYFTENLTMTEVRRLLAGPAEGIDQRVQRFEKELEAAVIAASAAAPDDLASSFGDAFVAARVEHEITEDLEDENFEVKVVFPGQVTSTNGKASGNEVIFTFDGVELRDNTVVFFASAEVAD